MCVEDGLRDVLLTGKRALQQSSQVELHQKRAEKRGLERPARPSDADSDKTVLFDATVGNWQLVFLGSGLLTSATFTGGKKWGDSHTSCSGLFYLDQEKIMEDNLSQIALIFCIFFLFHISSQSSSKANV